MALEKFDSRVFMAPMAGITDMPFRRIVSSFGSGNLISEMVAINALQRKNPKSWKIADVRNENYPVTVQLVGNSPELFAEAAKLVAELGAKSIDINMGCPVKKIVNNNSGSALLKDEILASKIIEATVKATPLKVSVKFRKGWDNEHINAVSFAKMCEQSGAEYITVHGRTRAQGYSGVADWNIIGEVKSSVKIPVIGNGDIDTPEKAQERIDQTGVDGIMVGRALLGHPWLLNKIHCALKGLPEPENQDIEQIKNTLLEHLRFLVQYYGEFGGLAVSRKHIGWYVRGLYEAKRFREEYTKINDIEKAKNLIDEYFSKVII